MRTSASPTRWRFSRSRRIRPGRRLQARDYACWTAFAELRELVGRRLPSQRAWSRRKPMCEVGVHSQGFVDPSFFITTKLRQSTKLYAWVLVPLEIGEGSSPRRSADLRSRTDRRAPPSSAPILRAFRPTAIPPFRQAFVPAPSSNVNGLTVHMLEAGFESPGRPAVLLLHGFPELAFSWRKVMLPLVSAGYHIIPPDQRGYGHCQVEAVAGRVGR